MIVEGKKYCPKCTEEKTVDLWFKNKNRSDGLSSWCKSCSNVGISKWQAANSEKISKRAAEKYKAMSEGERKNYSLRCAEVRRAKKDYHILKKYGMSWDDYQTLIEKQEGKCLICKKKPEKLVVDHDHACCPGAVTCGKCVRGLLCIPCNGKLGVVENLNWMKEANSYLKFYSFSEEMNNEASIHTEPNNY